MRDLRGRTALVTGASRGIGPYIAGALAAEGMNLALAARSVPELEEVASRLRSGGARAIAVPADLADVEAGERLAARVDRELGRIDVLVNNAALEVRASFVNISREDVQQMVQVNLIAPMELSRLVLPAMMERRSGHIVNISSLAGKIGIPYFELYVATKAGLIGFSRSLRAECHGSGVGVSVILPGYVREAGLFKRNVRDRGLSVSPLAGTSSPHQVARAVVRAIKYNRPEIIVNPRSFVGRLFTASLDLFPSLNEPAVRLMGIDDLYRKTSATISPSPLRGRGGEETS